MELPSKCEDCTCMGLVFCVWGGWRGGVWVTDAVRLYRTRCAIPSHPSASPPGSRGASQRSVRQDLWGKFSPNPLLHFLTEENNRAELANKMGTLMYAPDFPPPAAMLSRWIKIKLTPDFIHYMGMVFKSKEMKMPSQLFSWGRSECQIFCQNFICLIN